MTKEQALNRLMGECSRNEMCSGQARAKLEKWMAAQKTVVLTQPDIEEIIKTLVKEKFIDDARFAGAYIRDRYKFYGWGPRKVEFQMKTLGIPVEIIKEAIETESELAAETLKKIVAAKSSEVKRRSERATSHKNDDDTADESSSYKVQQQARAKIIKFALSRGFDYGEIMKAIKE
ncbi:MAG: RecX family transcriptional regulator [Bacteroidales bacterium]|jgi:regulatory protein|nr:RecX family transcriptional regulator [Bacteroidales bacterium]MCI1733146.1 RecX family transcriptional regulator [Bacteroidales bacterium]